MQTKTCPYCGEEILAIAKKCKHCGEFLDKEVITDSSKVNSLDVNDSWKRRFKVVEQQVEKNSGNILYLKECGWEMYFTLVIL